MARRPIGVFDSGVGGLTVFDAISRALPHEPLVYYGDTARVPYGTRSPETVVRYSLEATDFLRSHDIGLLVVACNTASSVALEEVERRAGVPVVGVIEPGARHAAERSTTGRIGVIGTRATIDSGAYPEKIKRFRPEADVVGRACPLFVPLAEEGWTEGEVAEAAARRYLDPLHEHGVDTVVLGCTHYPLLKHTIQKVLGPDVHLVDSAEVVARDVRGRIERTGPVDMPTHHFFVTDVPGPFREVAERFLGRPIDRIERV